MLAVPATSPSFAGTFTSIPLFNFVSVLSVSNVTPFTFMLPGTNVVPVGIVSLITTSYLNHRHF